MTTDTVVTVIGCSGSVVSPDAAGSCYLVTRGGRNLLLDVGSGAASPLQRLADFRTIDMVVITHGHHDHWADLNQLAYLRAHGGCPPIPLVAPADVPQELDFASGWVRTTHASEAATASFDLTLARVPHTDDSWAVRVGDDLCYTGDTQLCDEITDLASGVGVLLSEAVCLDRDKPRGHLSAADAGRLATASGCRLLVLTHARPWEDPYALLAEAAAHTDAVVVAACPGLRWTC